MQRAKYLTGYLSRTVVIIIVATVEYFYFIMPVTFRGKSVSSKEIIPGFIHLLLGVKLIFAPYFERA